MKKVVMLAPYFLPRRRVGVWRPFKFAVHLRKFGWQPAIITLKSEGIFTKKEKRMLEGIPVCKVEPPFDFTHKSESSRSVFGENASNEKKTSQFISAVSRRIDRHFPIDTWLPLFLTQQKSIKKAVSKFEPDLIWSTGDPWSSHWLANKLAKEFKMPWVADFRDPWTLGKINLKERSRFSSSIDKRVEKKVVKSASALTFTAKGTETLYRNYYQKLKPKTTTIYNSFDLELYKKGESKQKNFDSSYLNLIFFGSFRSRSPAKSFIKVLQKMRQKYEVDSEKIRMYSFGPLNHSDKMEAKQAGVLGQFKKLKPIPPEEALLFLNQADFLWLTAHPALKNVIPAKLWDYLAAKKPILSLSPNPEINSILKKTQTGKQFQMHQLEEIAEVLINSLLSKRQGKEPSSLPFYNPDEEQISLFSSAHATQRLAELFDNLR